MRMNSVVCMSCLSEQTLFPSFSPLYSGGVLSLILAQDFFEG